MPKHCTRSLNLSNSRKTKRKMNPKWTHSEIIKSDLFTCLVLVFLYSATTFFKILAKSLYSILVFLFNEWGRYLKLAGHGEPWLSSLWKAAPRICVQRDARRYGRDSHFCGGVIYIADTLWEEDGLGCFKVLHGQWQAIWVQWKRCKSWPALSVRKSTSLFSAR